MNKRLGILLTIKGLFDESTKWYDFEKDMREYSKNHSATVFCNYGGGRVSSENVWHYLTEVKEGKEFESRI